MSDAKVGALLHALKPLLADRSLYLPAGDNTEEFLNTLLEQPWPSAKQPTTGQKETNMSNGINFPGADKLMSRFFRKADGVVWDLMTGKIGVITDEGIATLDGTGEDATVNINLMDEFGMPLPAFAQSTPKGDVQIGDIIVRSDKNARNIAWVVNKTEDGDKIKFRLIKPNGEFANWNPPKVSLMGMDGGIMVLRSLMTMLPNGDKGLGQMQSMLLPMMMMSGGDLGGDLEKMMPLMLMSQMNGAGGDAGGMGNMMQTMMLMKMMGGSNGGSPFNRR